MQPSPPWRTSSGESFQEDPSIAIPRHREYSFSVDDVKEDMTHRTHHDGANQKAHPSIPQEDDGSNPCDQDSKHRSEGMYVWRSLSIRRVVQINEYCRNCGIEIELADAWKIHEDIDRSLDSCSKKHVYEKRRHFLIPQTRLSKEVKDIPSGVPSSRQLAVE